MRNKKLWKQLIIVTSLSVAFASTSIVAFASDPTDEVVEVAPEVSDTEATAKEVTLPTLVQGVPATWNGGDVTIKFNMGNASNVKLDGVVMGVVDDTFGYDGNLTNLPFDASTGEIRISESLIREVLGFSESIHNHKLTGTVNIDFMVQFSSPDFPNYGIAGDSAGTMTYTETAPEPEKPQPEPEKPQPEPEKPQPEKPQPEPEKPQPEKPEKPEPEKPQPEKPEKPEKPEQPDIPLTPLEPSTPVDPDASIPMTPLEPSIPNNGGEVEKPEQKPEQNSQTQQNNTNTNKNNKVSSETKAPKTGDTSSALPVAGAGLASLGVALATILRKRK